MAESPSQFDVSSLNGAQQCDCWRHHSSSLVCVRSVWPKQQQQSYSGLRSPGRSNSTYFWNDSWVQTFHNGTFITYRCKIFQFKWCHYFFVFGSNKIGNGQTKLSFKLKLLTALSISRGKFGLIFDFLEQSLKISIVFYSVNWKWPNETFLHALCS